MKNKKLIENYKEIQYLKDCIERYLNNCELEKEKLNKLLIK